MKRYGALGLVVAAALAAGIVHSASAVSLGAIAVDGRSIPRLAPAPVAPADQAKVDAFFSGFTAAPVTDFHSAAAAQDAMALTVTDGHGDPIRLGDVAFVRPGLGNIMFSPAQIYMLARHFRTVVLLYTNMTDPDAGARAFRRVTELEGIPIPSEIAGGVRIFAVGSPQLNVISYLQQSDVMLEQLELLRQHSATLGFDPLAADRWVFAHSQGVTDAVLTDHRLRKAGLPGFGRIVGIAGATRGGRLIEAPIGAFFIQSAEDAAGDQGKTALAALGATASTRNLVQYLDIRGANQEEKLVQRLSHRIFAAFGGILDPGAPQGNVRSSFLFLAGLADGNGIVNPNDGVEDASSTLLGKHSFAFQQVDHILITEDPALLRAMVQELARYAD